MKKDDSQPTIGAGNRLERVVSLSDHHDPCSPTRFFPARSTEEAEADFRARLWKSEGTTIYRCED